MRLGTTNKSTTTGGGFRNIGTVKSVELKYDHQEKWQKYSNDVFLQVSYNDGQEFDKTLKIYGNFKRDKKSWGSAFKVEKFFKVCGVNTADINDDWTIPDTWFDEVIGKEFSVISYPTQKTNPNTGKPYWEIWDIVESVATPEAAHKEAFMTSVNDGYVYNYKSNDASIEMDTATKEEPPVFKGLDLSNA